MATIYLRHPDHGEKVATLEQEAQYDETLGWVRFFIDNPTTEIDESTVSRNELFSVLEPQLIEPTPEPEPEPTPAPRGRGRPRNVEPEPEVTEGE